MTKQTKEEHCPDRRMTKHPHFWLIQVTMASLSITTSAPHYFPRFLEKIIKLSNDRITSLLDSI